MTSIFKPGNTAVITGGASGIGLALAQKCAKSGMKVLVADVNKENLEAASRATTGGAVTTFAMDVSKEDDWARLKGVVDADFEGKLSLLALNAGVARPFSWEDVAGFRATMDTNLFGVVNGIAALVPAVERAAAGGEEGESGPRAAVVITGSKQGITNPPGNAAYNASKAAVKSVAEGLSFELRREAPRLAVHLLVPGWTFTGMTGGTAAAAAAAAVAGGGGPPKGSWLPAQVVDFLVRKMDEGKFYVVCPDDDVSEEMDRKRMLWAVGDVVEGRPPLTRWREEWKERAQEGMDKL